MDENLSVEKVEVAEQPTTQIETSETKVEVAEQPFKNEENAKFAQFRREKEEAIKQKSLVETENQRIMGVLKSLGYEGSPQEVADLLEAQAKKVDVDVIKKEREELERKSNLEKELDTYRNELVTLKAQQQMKEDLIKIQTINPQVKSLEELGEDFFKLISSGVDAELAYRVANEKKKATEKPIPPSMGAIQDSTGEKDYYTPEEVDKLSKKDLDNPKIFEKVRQSMTKWK